MPPITASRVDLPEPDGPTTLTELPAATSRSTPRRILTGPAVLESVTCTSRSWIMAGRSVAERGMARQMVRSRRLLKVALGACDHAGRAGRHGERRMPDRRARRFADHAPTASPSRTGSPRSSSGALRDGGPRLRGAGCRGRRRHHGRRARARLDWMLADRPSHVIVELGGNDGLRALPPEQMEQNLDAIVSRLQADGVAVLLAGMLAPPNLGRTYGEAFAAVFSAVAERHDVPLYPFFLDGRRRRSRAQPGATASIPRPRASRSSSSGSCRRSPSGWNRPVGRPGDRG